MVKCDNCGKENQDEATQCSQCNEPLNAEQEAPKKSKVIAVILALIFGPLGLLYLGMEGMLVLLLVVGVGTFVAPIILPATNGTG